ncbi:glycoside hydrolase family 15 protein [Ramlibacter sp. RBP-2]|uniref:Trehalase n=1 Tax=Ramlibacter lithotrophicus TaxID=2606681 RepID=A0A7X6I7R6_9BURK|nr:glycoside hydrolase family 15 protein [Ramlibacter lithotrophicus]NKE67600.1 glycoside hydrolase family 15 protein [Ramlibacter lithotrophicus]
MPLRLEDYALLGDCESAALLGRDGSVDWLCWPRFDSGALLAALLGTPEHGRWLLAPVDVQAQSQRRYRAGTVIVETRWETPSGCAVVTDFMPVRGVSPHLVRIVSGLSGEVQLRMELVLRFDYGGTVPWVARLPDGRGIRAIAGPDKVVLRSPVPSRGEDLRTLADFPVRAGDRFAFSLSYTPSHLPDPAPVDAEAALRRTDAFWTEWSARCRHQGEWHDAVLRSHITLKALTYAPTGAIVAAPTTSLPEQQGGARNWDYRYCWLRDATFTLLSLMDAGYMDEARAWREWLLRAVAGLPARAQIMYGLGGERRLPEWEVPWLPGYEGARPVRVGNAAHGQLQLDVFGEVADALYQARCAGLEAPDAGWDLERALVDHLCTVWEQPDEGIWEVRGGRRHFTHSKVMAWVAVDRAVRAAQRFGLQAPLEHWRDMAQRIHGDACSHGYDARLGTFVQSYGSDQLDASLLLLPLVGFLPASDPRIQGTLAAIEHRLLRDGLVLRYDTSRGQDGLPPGEGAFLPCSFWFVDNLLLQGRREQALAMFERLLSLRNDLGLLAEEYDPVAGRQLGNFPQAFSHLALADTARNLGSAHGPVQRRQVTQSGNSDGNSQAAHC